MFGWLEAARRELIVDCAFSEKVESICERDMAQDLLKQNCCFYMAIRNEVIDYT